MANTRKATRTSHGHPVSDELIEELAREAELGYDPAQLRRRGGRKPMGSGPAEVLAIRLDPELRAATEKRAAENEETTSDVIRRALRAYLGIA